MYQVGLFFQAGFVTLWLNASVEIGTCDIAINAAFSGVMSAAKSAAKCSGSIHQLPSLSGLERGGGFRQSPFDRGAALTLLQPKGSDGEGGRTLRVIAGLGDGGPAIAVAHQHDRAVHRVDHGFGV